MGKLPALQFYPADWRKDIGVQSLSLEHRAIWFEMICIMHECEERGKLSINGTPMDAGLLAKLIGITPKKLRNAIQIMKRLNIFSVENDVIINRRMVRDEYIRNVRKAAGSEGGNPILLENLDKQNTSKTTKSGDKQKTTPSSSSSISSSTSIKKYNTVSTDLNFEGYEPELVEALKVWVAYRKERKGKLVIKTQKELDGQRDRLKRISGINTTMANAVIKCCTESKWDGIYPIPENLKSVYLPQEKKMVY